MKYLADVERIREALRTTRLRPALGYHIARALGIPLTTLYYQLGRQGASIKGLVAAERERRFKAWCQARGSLDELHEALGYVGISETRRYVRRHTGHTVKQWQRAGYRPELAGLAFTER